LVQAEVVFIYFDTNTLLGRLVIGGELFMHISGHPLGKSKFLDSGGSIVATLCATVTGDGRLCETQT
jgi:hypothetical protein